MPIFDFHCAQCGTDFEALVAAGQMPPCPACESAAVSKCYSPTQAPPRSPGILAAARQQAAREGHFSNYAAKDKPRLK